jgi:predicted nucleic acid-binding protein
MANFTVVYDACVLYPAPLRDLLMRLALTDLFRARWTEDIHEEWIRNVLANRPDLTREQLDRTRTLMNENVRDCVVEGYRDLIDSLELPDPDDRHVLAAAIRAHADAIVTFNLEDFPAARLAEFGIEAQHPDEFIEHLIDLNQAKVCASVEDHLHSLRNPPKTRDQYLDTLLRQGLPQTANLLRVHCFAA